MRIRHSEFLQERAKKIRWKTWIGEGYFGRRIFVAFLFFITLAFFLHFREVRMEMLELGTIAEKYIIAQVDFEFADEEATHIFKQQSVRDIGTIYRLLEKDVAQSRFDFESYLLTHQDWRDKLESTTFDEMYRGADALETALLDVRFTKGRTIQKIKEHQFSSENYFLLSSLSVHDASSLPKDFWERIRQKIFGSGDYHQEAIDFILSAFENQLWNLKQDIPGERTLRMTIQEKVPDQYTQVKAGTRIIDPGEKVTNRHLTMLQAMKEALAKERNLWAPRTIMGSVLLSLLFTALSIIYFRIKHPDILNSLQKMILIVSIVILTLILSKVAEYLLVSKATHLIDIFRYPIIIPFATILIFVLVSSEVALFSSAFLTIILGVTLALHHDRFLMINLIASWVTMLFARNMHKRKEIFSVLGKVWLVCIPIILLLILRKTASY